MSANPAFASVVVLALGAVSAANTNRDGTGTIVDLAVAAPGTTAAPAAGRRIDRFRLKATGTTVSSLVAIYVHDGTAYRLLTEVQITAIAPSATLKSYETEFAVYDLVLQSGEKLAASISAAPTTGDVKVYAFGGDLT